MSKNSERIREAIDNVESLIPGYWHKTLKKHLASETSAGSVVDVVDTPEELDKLIAESEWTEAEHPAIAEGSTLFQAAIPGLLGVVALSQLPRDKVVTLDDRKGTGQVSATIDGVLGEKVAHSSIILSIEDGMEVAATFHPGDPVVPSPVPTENRHGDTVTVEEALEMGLTTANIV